MSLDQRKASCRQHHGKHRSRGLIETMMDTTFLPGISVSHDSKSNPPASPHFPVHPSVTGRPLLMMCNTGTLRPSLANLTTVWCSCPLQLLVDWLFCQEGKVLCERLVFKVLDIQTLPGPSSATLSGTTRQLRSSSSSFTILSAFGWFTPCLPSWYLSSAQLILFHENCCFSLLKYGTFNLHCFL